MQPPVERALEQDEAVVHDVLVVGSGSAGGVLAARLSEDPHRSVLLVEAGADLRAQSDVPAGASRGGGAVEVTPYLWSYEVELTPGTIAQQVRGRILGGSTAVNGVNFARGAPEDHDSWGSPLWSYDAVLPSLRRLETDHDFHEPYHGDAGPVHVWRLPRAQMKPVNQGFYAAALDVYPEKPDLNRPDGSGVGPATRNDYGGPKMTTALTYLGPARTRPNLHLRVDTTVERVVFDGERAIGVAAVSGGRRVLLRAREVVLSAGVFGSAQLLLVSGVGPAAALRTLGIKVVADRPGVGENLNCNPSIKVPIASPAPVEAGPTSAPEVFVVYTSAASRERNDMSLMPRRLGAGLFIQAQLRLPRSSGRLTLRSADPAVAPRIQYGYLDPADVERLTEAAAISRDLLARPAMTTLGFRNTDEPGVGTPEWVRATVHTPYHAGGTCRLGPASDPRAVVDERCRVHGVSGLRVVDLAIAPRPVRAGPALTAVMIGERVAELMRTD